MPSAAQLALYVSIVLSSAAAGVSVWAARRSPDEFRQLHITVAALSLVYVVGYSWLAFTDIDAGKWSETMRYVSLFAWPVVWIVPAILMARSGRAVRSAKATVERHG